MSTKTEVKTDDKPKSALKEHVLKLATQIQEAMTVDAKTGILTTQADVYEKTLPEGLTLEIANKLNEHDANFIAASSYAIGTIAVDAMKSHKKLATVETLINMAGKNTLSLTVERERSYLNPQDKENPVVKYAVVTPIYDVTAGAKVGQLKVARSLINDLGAASLK